MNSNKPDLMQHFDKILLCSILLLCIGLHTYMVHQAIDLPYVSWIENVAGQVLAAMLTLMVTRKKEAVNELPNGGKTNGNGSNGNVAGSNTVSGAGSAPAQSSN